jgi:hypothetical protein
MVASKALHAPSNRANACGLDALVLALPDFDAKPTNPPYGL